MSSHINIFTSLTKTQLCSIYKATTEDYETEAMRRIPSWVMWVNVLNPSL